ncbi:hypothetical protein BJ166DRAFT_604868, partial [Pestalotiopsis sp. NC0098]
AETKKTLARRAQPLAVSRCGNTLRIGTRLYSRSSGGMFHALNTAETDLMPYIDEISCRGEFVAVASRRRLTTRDLQERPIQEVLEIPEDTGAETRLNESRQQRSETSSDTDSSGADYSSENRESDCETSEDGAVTGRNVSRNINRSGKESDHASSMSTTSRSTSSMLTSSMSTSSDSESDEESIESLSASESLREGSTDAASDEIEDEFWNDFASDSDQLEFDFKESNEVEQSDHESVVVDDASPSDVDSSSADSFSISPGSSNGDTNSSEGLYETSLADDEDEDDSNGYSSPFDSTDGRSDSGSDDEAWFKAGKRLERLLKPRDKIGKLGELTETRIFRAAEISDGAPQRVFRFFQRSMLPISGSPPVFHPKEDLVVWPLGDGDLLFANFTNNRYFIREISSGYKRSCQITCHCQFSPCGQ